jgi:hypothetical protein
MKNIVELEDVYLEYSTALDDENVEETKMSNTTKMSLEDLQKKLEETQGLRL